MAGYDIERYLNVRSASGASFGPDGERLSFLIDTTGTNQVWRLDSPGAWPDQLTFGEERVTFADWSPTREELAFGMDEGGNERVQLYRLAADGSTVDPLTGMPDAKHLWGGWSQDGNRLAFASNRRETSVFDVYVQGREEGGEDAELVCEGDGWLSAAGWSPSDDRLLLHESHSSFDHDVYVLDLASGERTHLTPSEEAVRYQGVHWGPDGSAIYLLTDWGSDTLYFGRLDVESGDISVVAEGGDWNVDRLALDDETGRFVFAGNVDGYSSLTVGELTGETTYRTLAEPQLSEGVYSGLELGPAAEQFAVTVSGRSRNANVYVADLAGEDVTRWTDAATAGIPRQTFVEPALVRYPTFDGREIPAFFTTPPDAGAGETPVIVDIHGGPEAQRRPSFHPLAQYFVGRGFAYFEPNVRGSAGYGRAYTHLDDVEKRMDSVRDIEAGVQWLHDQPAVDPDRIVALGGSYGGFMVLAALTQYPERWAAGVDIVGIANFETFLENTGSWRREHREAEYGSLAADREFLAEISPINNIESIAAPLFVAHGAQDPRVPLGEAEQVAERAREQGVPVEMLVFEDEGHGFAKLSNRIEAYTAITEFIEEHV